MLEDPVGPVHGRLRGGSEACSREAEHQGQARTSIEGHPIRGALRTPDGSTVLGENLSPYEAFRRLIQWDRTGQ